MDLSSIASAYAAFGGTLAAFAFGGLSFYVTRPLEPRARNEVDVVIKPDGEPAFLGSIKESIVAASGFYAMASLGISTFLYAHLAGEGGAAPKGQAETALLVYGVVLALSVLALFYFMTLILFEHSLTRLAARSAFWAGTFAGSVVVWRFLASSAQAAMSTRCRPHHSCRLGWAYTTGHIAILVVVIAAFFAVITLTRVLEAPGLNGCVKFFSRHPSFPSACVFLTAVAVAVLESLYLDSRLGRKYVPSSIFINVVYIIGSFLVMIFGVGSGSVIYPRVHSTRLTNVPGSVRDIGNTIPWWRRFFAWYMKQRRLTYMRYHSGVRPRAERRRLIWVIPPASGLPSHTRIRVLNGESSCLLAGNLRLVSAAGNMFNEAKHAVHVKLRTGPDTSVAIEIDISTDPKGVNLEGRKLGECKFIDIVISRRDRSPDDVLLCWREVGGTLKRCLVPRAGSD
jgi:hypothetical protein